MKKIKLVDWKAIDNDGKEVVEDITTVLAALLTVKDPATLPRGFNKAQMFRRIIKSFESAHVSRELIIDDEDYAFFKLMIETDTPANWGANKNIMKALDEFNSL